VTGSCANNNSEPAQQKIPNSRKKKRKTGPQSRVAQQKSSCLGLISQEKGKSRDKGKKIPAFPSESGKEKEGRLPGKGLSRKEGEEKFREPVAHRR